MRITRTDDLKVETDRLAELRRYGILGSEPDDSIQSIVELAAEIFDAPISLVSLVDEDRQWFLAKTGISASEMLRKDAICAHTLKCETSFVVPDTWQDSTLKDNPLVTGAPYARFYAGIPLRSPNGHALGSICVIDHKPREVLDFELRQLEILAASTMAFINHRYQLLESRRLLAERDESRRRLRNIIDRISVFVGVMDTEGILLEVNQTSLEAARIPSDYVLGKHLWETFWFSHSAQVQDQLKRAFKAASAGEVVRFDSEISDARAHTHTIDISIRPMFDDNGELEFLVSSAVDVSEKRRAEKELFAAKESAEIILDSICDAVIATDETGKVTELNSAAERLLRITEDAAVGAPITEVLNLANEESQEAIPNPVLTALQTSQVVALDAQSSLLGSNSDARPVTGTVSPIIDELGVIEGSVAVLRDVTEERAKSARLIHQASHDPLTDLPNRREFERRLGAMLQSANSNGFEHALCYLDLDDFKPVNDQYGHEAGDALLIQLSELMRGKIRSRDSLARLGGDEFALILGDCPPDRALAIANELCSSVKNFRFIWQTNVIAVAVSIGLTFISENNSELKSIISAADNACYEAKRSGKNQVHVFASQQSAA